MRPAAVGTLLLFTLVLGGCTDEPPESPRPEETRAIQTGYELVAGPRGGRLVVDDGFALEVTIFESGIPPEFRLWASHDGVPVDPNEVDVRIILERLGGGQDEIHFEPRQGYLKGDAVVYEPHSFIVNVEAKPVGALKRRLVWSRRRIRCSGWLATFRDEECPALESRCLGRRGIGVPAKALRARLADVNQVMSDKGRGFEDRRSR